MRFPSLLTARVAWYRGPFSRTPLRELPMFRPGLVVVLLAACVTAAPQTAETPKKPVTDTYHGTAVVDDYQWLEDWNSKDVRNWSEAQNSRARSVLDKLPG